MRMGGGASASSPSRLVVQRIAAYLIDIALLFAFLAPAGLLIQPLLGATPSTGPEVALRILWNLSVPAWIYFICSDRSTRGATLGKRWLGLHVTSPGRRPLSLARSALRTAVKLLPWELVHLSAFGLSRGLEQLTPVQAGGLVLANLLTIAYLVLVIATGGRRSVHDYVARTTVEEV